MCVALQVEQLPLIGEDVLNPQPRRIGMWCGLVHDGDIRTGNRGIRRNDDLEIRLACQLIAETEAQVVPHNGDSYLAFGDVGNARTCWREVPLFLQLCKE